MIALFDFDGVIMDTEGLYTEFWAGLSKKYFDNPDFGLQIKGQTLKQIYEKHFPDNPEAQRDIEAALERFEHDMPYRFIPGAEEFLAELKGTGVPTAIVTSSNRQKMENVYRAFPDFESRVGLILTSESFARSKPAPDCFLLGMEKLGGAPESTFIFEDSFHGLAAARDSGGIVVGLATTNSREAIAAKADHIIDDFTGMSVAHLHGWLGK